MTKQALLLAALLALAACSGNSSNPLNGFGSDEETVDPDPDANADEGIPDVLRQNVTDIGFDAGDPADPTDDVLTIEGVNLDDSPFAAEYTRRASLDVEGYQAYVRQDDRLSRMYVAVGATSADGAVRAASVSDGGQFNVFFRGSSYERLVPLTRPSVNDSDGQVSYAGTYAGVTNLEDIGQGERLPLQPGDEPSLQPAQPRQTQGRVFMNVDFADNSVEGAIYDRQFTDGKPLPSIVLTPGNQGEDANNLDDDGEFFGQIQFAGRPDLGNQGNFGGVIGGTDASAMAGAIHMDNIFNPEASDPLDGTFDRESGTFVLPRCGTPAAPAICDGLSDVD